jgi:hypothetical protein
LVLFETDTGVDIETTCTQAWYQPEYINVYLRAIELNIQLTTYPSAIIMWDSGFNVGTPSGGSHNISIAASELNKLTNNTLPGANKSSIARRRSSDPFGSKAHLNHSFSLMNTSSN